MITTGSLFLGFAIIFLALTLRDYLRDAGQLTPKRKTWLLVALIFAAVSMVQYLYLLLFA